MAYAKVKSPKLYFNFAQAHRSMGQLIPALEFFEKFLIESEQDTPELRLEAERQIVELEKRRGHSGSAG